jgi:hypothetical protein
MGPAVSINKNNLSSENFAKQVTSTFISNSQSCSQSDITSQVVTIDPDSIDCGNITIDIKQKMTLENNKNSCDLKINNDQNLKQQLMQLANDNVTITNPSKDPNWNSFSLNDNENNLVVKQHVENEISTSVNNFVNIVQNKVSQQIAEIKGGIFKCRDKIVRTYDSNGVKISEIITPTDFNFTSAQEMVISGAVIEALSDVIDKLDTKQEASQTSFLNSLQTIEPSTLSSLATGIIYVVLIGGVVIMAGLYAKYGMKNRCNNNPSEFGKKRIRARERDINGRFMRFGTPKGEGVEGVEGGTEKIEVIKETEENKPRIVGISGIMLSLIGVIVTIAYTLINNPNYDSTQVNKSLLICLCLFIFGKFCALYWAVNYDGSTNPGKILAMITILIGIGCLAFSCFDYFMMDKSDKSDKSIVVNYNYINMGLEAFLICWGIFLIVWFKMNTC